MVENCADKNNHFPSLTCVRCLTKLLEKVKNISLLVPVTVILVTDCFVFHFNL